MSNEIECRTSSVVPRLFATPRTVAHQAPMSMGLPRQEYWSGLPSPSPGDLPSTLIICVISHTDNHPMSRSPNRMLF